MTTTQKILPILMAVRTWTDVDGSFVASIVGLGRRHHFLDLFENGGISCYYLGHPGQGPANVGKCCAIVNAVAICCSNLAINEQVAIVRCCLSVSGIFNLIVICP